MCAVHSLAVVFHVESRTEKVAPVEPSGGRVAAGLRGVTKGNSGEPTLRPTEGTERKRGGTTEGKCGGI